MWPGRGFLAMVSSRGSDMSGAGCSGTGEWSAEAVARDIGSPGVHTITVPCSDELALNCKLPATGIGCFVSSCCTSEFVESRRGAQERCPGIAVSPKALW